MISRPTTISGLAALSRGLPLPSERRRRIERWLRGWSEAEALRGADAAVVSYGKSGRTWLRLMLTRFYQVLANGRADYVQGTRLVYPMEKKAMRPLNWVGNKFFSLAFSMLLGQSIKDTLCGTKVLAREDYDRIVENRAYFGEFDPFGDFDLIFGAAKLNLQIVDMPVRYRERTYGETNIERWKHGWLLLKMVAFAARRIKFV